MSDETALVTAAQGDARTLADARRARWQSFLGAAVVRLLGLTWRVRWVGDGPVRAHQRDVGPVVYALWHGELLPLLWAHVGMPVSILISTHRDGELIARIAMRLGFMTVRGSSSRSADRALIGLVRELKAGRTIALTPDGPRGPRHAFAPGALVAAHRGGAAIVPPERIKCRESGRTTTFGSSAARTMSIVSSRVREDVNIMNSTATAVSCLAAACASACSVSTLRTGSASSTVAIT